jgi:hypothetical protein
MNAKTNDTRKQPATPAGTDTPACCEPSGQQPCCLPDQSAECCTPQVAGTCCKPSQEQEARCC